MLVFVWNRSGTSLELTGPVLSWWKNKEVVLSQELAPNQPWTSLVENGYLRLLQLNVLSHCCFRTTDQLRIDVKVCRTSRPHLPELTAFARIQIPIHNSETVIICTHSFCCEALKWTKKYPFSANQITSAAMPGSRKHCSVWSALLDLVWWSADTCLSLCSHFKSAVHIYGCREEPAGGLSAK